ncbi:B-box zinc finger protein [Neptuniibacter caesariensis]|nr:B-box zinc finger protein [Neptuniibacter caesariensis]
MDYCKYHPTVAATFKCKHCDMTLCDQCVDHSEDGIRCFICGEELESLGAGHDITPFWRRLDKAFKYPMNRETMLLIVIASVVSSFGALIGGISGFVLGLIVTAATTKFSFMCLQHTADGKLECPEAKESLSGGLKIVLHFIAIFIFISLMIYGVSQSLGETASVIAILFWTISLPAIFVSYARNESIIDAINPIEIIKLVSALGGSYFLLLLFLSIMAASVGTLNHILSDFYFFSTVLQSIVSYYYLVVIFHLMGYLIFQKQKKLGFVSRFDDDDALFSRPESQRESAKLNVLAKAGKFDELEATFRDLVKSNPDDLFLSQKMMDFFEAAKKYDRVDSYFPGYLDLIEKNNRAGQAVILYQKLTHKNPDYQLATAETRFRLANLCLAASKPALAVKLINGIHRDHPDFTDMVAAYETMLAALKEIPGRGMQAEKCEQLLEKLRGKFAS